MIHVRIFILFSANRGLVDMCNQVLSLMVDRADKYVSLSATIPNSGLNQSG